MSITEVVKQIEKVLLEQAKASKTAELNFIVKFKCGGICFVSKTCRENMSCE